MDRCPTCGAQLRVGDIYITLFDCNGWVANDDTHFCPSALAKERNEMREVLASIYNQVGTMQEPACKCRMYDDPAVPKCDLIYRECRAHEVPADCPIAKFVNERGKA